MHKNQVNFQEAFSLLQALGTDNMLCVLARRHHAHGRHRSPNHGVNNGKLVY